MTSVPSISRLLMRAWAPVSFMVGSASCRGRVAGTDSEGNWAEKTPRRGEG